MNSQSVGYIILYVFLIICSPGYGQSPQLGNAKDNDPPSNEPIRLEEEVGKLRARAVPSSFMDFEQVKAYIEKSDQEDQKELEKEVDGIFQEFQGREVPSEELGVRFGFIGDPVAEKTLTSAATTATTLIINYEDLAVILFEKVPSFEKQIKNLPDVTSQQKALKIKALKRYFYLTKYLCIKFAGWLGNPTTPVDEQITSFRKAALKGVEAVEEKANVLKKAFEARKESGELSLDDFHIKMKVPSAALENVKHSKESIDQQVTVLQSMTSFMKGEQVKQFRTDLEDWSMIADLQIARLQLGQVLENTGDEASRFKEKLETISKLVRELIRNANSFEEDISGKKVLP